jgi:hypothetical protein
MNIHAGRCSRPAVVSGFEITFLDSLALVYYYLCNFNEINIFWPPTLSDAASLSMQSHVDSSLSRMGATRAQQMFI